MIQRVPLRTTLYFIHDTKGIQWVDTDAIVYFLLEGLFPLPFPDGFPVLLGAFRGLPLLFPPLLFPLPPLFAMVVNYTEII